MSETELIGGISRAIAKQEGWFVPDSVARRHNNPGNLRSWGDNPIVNGYAQFKNEADGWAALFYQVQKNVRRKLSLRQFFGGKLPVYSGYAPSKDGNQPIAYAAFVAKYLGLDSIDMPLNELCKKAEVIEMPKTEA